MENKIEMSLERYFFSEKKTIGRLFIEGDYYYTLEDAVRDVKIAGETCIPYGVYDVKMTMSMHFKKVLPLLIGVPNYTGVRIHSGNTEADTQGCILVGMSIKNETLRNSKLAMVKIMDKLYKATDIKISITKKQQG